MRKNPYNPSFGKKPERFLGRDTIVHEVLTALDNENSPWRTTLVTGVRGSGKTALLSDISDSAAVVGCIVISVTSERFMLEDILSQLHTKIPKALGGKLPKPSKVTIGAVELDVNHSAPYFLNNFRHQITQMLGELKRKRLKVLFLVDEAQKHSEEMRTFITTYQHLIREGFDVYLAMAGLPNIISDILNDSVLTFLRRANQVILDNVDLSLVSFDYIEVFMDEFDVSGEILEKAAMVTKGYPYLIQLVGFYLWVNLSSGADKAVILDKVIVQAKAMMFQNVHKLLYRELSAGDRDFVFAMAMDERLSKFADIISRTGKAKNHLSTYRLRLLDRGYIKVVGRGELMFSFPFTREFLRQESNTTEP